ncbi:hypothetical protein [Treponema sp.]|uniref:hypothetical protein n=1 Tax=Treponema sp. TaxID=166 RepID=UPI00257C1A01|nr:hypothetical protein [Treponema sp.]MBE6354450.1 hypothetical protein [Treponema sp.]
MKLYIAILNSFILSLLFSGQHVYADSLDIRSVRKFSQDDFFCFETGKFDEEKLFLSGPGGMYFVEEDVFHLYSKKCGEDRYFKITDFENSYVEIYKSADTDFRTTRGYYKNEYFLNRDIIKDIKPEDKYLFENLHTESNRYVSFTDDCKGLVYYFFIAFFPDERYAEKFDEEKSRGVLIIEDIFSGNYAYRIFSFNSELFNKEIFSENTKFLLEARPSCAANTNGDFYFFNLGLTENEKYYELFVLKNTWWQELNVKERNIRYIIERFDWENIVYEKDTPVEIISCSGKECFVKFPDGNRVNLLTEKLSS